MKEITDNNLLELRTEVMILAKQWASNTYEIGTRLLKIKELTPHGEWGKWVDENLPFSQEHARRFMTVANEYSNSTPVLNLGIKKAYMLLDVPADEREEFIQSNPVAEMTTRELQQAIREKKEAEERAKELETKIDELENRPAEVIELIKEVKAEVIPDGYISPHEADKLKQQADACKDRETKARQEAAEAKNETKAYKQSLETFKGGARSMEQISLTDFKFAVRAFMRDVSPLVYLGEQFKDIKDSDLNKFYEEIELIERWCMDIKQALKGHSGGGNLIIIEGGIIND